MLLITRTGGFHAASPEGEETKSFRRKDNEVYGEIGLGDGWMLGGKAIHGVWTYNDGYEEQSGAGFGTIEAFVQKEIASRGNDVFTLRLAGSPQLAEGAAPRPDAGGESGALEARLGYGRTLTNAPVKAFATVDLGYRARFGVAADQFRVDFLLGLEPTPRVLALCEIFATRRIGAGAPGLDYDVVKVQPSLVWRATPRFSLHAGMTKEVWGRDLILGAAWFFGLWTDF